MSRWAIGDFWAGEWCDLISVSNCFVRINRRSSRVQAVRAVRRWLLDQRDVEGFAWMIMPWTVQIQSMVRWRIYLTIFRLQEEGKLLAGQEFRAENNRVQFAAWWWKSGRGKRWTASNDQSRCISLAVWPLLEAGWESWGLEGTMTA